MDWFDDDFENDDGFEDEFDQDQEMEDQFADGSEPDDESDHPDSEGNEFTARDAFIVGGAIGLGYEEGLRSRNRRKRKRLRDDDID